MPCRLRRLNRRRSEPAVPVELTSSSKRRATARKPALDACHAPEQEVCLLVPSQCRPARGGARTPGDLHCPRRRSPAEHRGGSLEEGYASLVFSTTSHYP